MSHTPSCFPAPPQPRANVMTVCVTVALVVMGSLAAAHAQQTAREESVFAAMWRTFAVESGGARSWAARLYEALAATAPAPVEALPEAVVPAEVSAPRPAQVATRIEHDDPYAVAEVEAEVIVEVAPPLSVSRTRPSLDVEDPYGVAGEAITVMHVPVAVPVTQRAPARLDDENPYL